MVVAVGDQDQPQGFMLIDGSHMEALFIDPDVRGTGIGRQLLQQAGVQMPLQIDFWYPTDVSRPYMPDPKRNFEAFAASLERSGRLPGPIMVEIAPLQTFYPAEEYHQDYARKKQATQIVSKAS